MKSLIRLLVIGLALAAAQIGNAATITWSGNASSNWFVAASWSPQTVPTAGDIVTIPNRAVTIPVGAAYAALNIGAGSSVYGTIDLTAAQTMGWTAGDIYASVLVESGSSVNISGTGTKSILGAWTNAGSISWAGTGTMNLYYLPSSSYFGSITNQSSGVITMQSDAPLGRVYGGETFGNAGILRKASGNSTSTVGVTFYNTGTVDVQTGTVSFTQGGSLGGQYTASANAVMNLGGGTFTQNGVATFSGAGVNRFNAGTLILSTQEMVGLALTGGTVNVTSGFQGGTITSLTVAGSNLALTNTVTGTLSWTDGAISGGLTIAPGGALNLTTTATKALYAALTNAGTITWVGNSTLNVYYLPGSGYFGSVTNLATGLFDIQGDAAMNRQYGGEFFNNAGTVRKSNSFNTTTIGTAFNNTGTVNVQTGTLSFTQGGSLGGQFMASASAIMNLGGGTFTQNGVATFSGAGINRFNGGTLVLSTQELVGLALTGGTVNVDTTFQGGTITSLTLAGSTLAVTNTVTGTLSWTDGAIIGGLTVAQGGALNLTTTATKALYGMLTNAGTITWQNNATINVYYLPGSGYFGSIINQATGLFDIQGDAAMNRQYGGEFFNNAGTVRKSNSFNTTTIGTAFNNTGTVNVQTGTISFTQGGSLGGQYSASASAVMNLGGGTFTQNGVPTFSGAGINRFNGGTLVLSTQEMPGLVLFGGTVTIAPSFQGGNITSLTVAGSTLAVTNIVTGTLNWTDGAIIGGLTIAQGGTLNITTTATKALYGALTNAGTITWQNNGVINVYYLPGSGYFGSLINQVTGLFDIQGDAGMNRQYGGEFVNNAGTFRKSGGLNTSTIGTTFNNTGTVAVQTGTLSFTQGGSLAGQYQTSAGAIMNLGAGTFTQNGVATFTGAGVNRFNGGTLVLSTQELVGLALTGGTVNVTGSFQGGSITSLTIAGATLAVTNTVTGTLSWTDGAIIGGLTVAQGGFLNITTTATKGLYGALTNAGTINWQNNGVINIYYLPGSGYFGSIINQATGLIDIQGDAGMNRQYGSEFINNAGTFRKSGGVNTTSVGTTFNNTGTVNVQTGTLSFTQGGSLFGQYLASAGAIMNLGAGTFTQNGLATFSGAGINRFNGGTLVLSTQEMPGLALTGGTVNIAGSFQGGSITSLTLAGSTLAVTNTVTGTLNWTDGAIIGGLTVAQGGLLNITTTATKGIYGALTNAGTITWQNNGVINIYYLPGSGYFGSITNKSTGLFDIQGDAGLNRQYGGEYFNNAGTVRKSGGLNTTTIGTTFNNSGTVNVQTGTLSFTQGGSLAGQFITSAGAIMNLGSGTFTQNGVATFTGAGTSQFNGGTLVLSTQELVGLVLSGGTVNVTGSFQGGSITNLTVSGSYLTVTNTVTGVLNWTDGAIGGGLTIAIGGTLNISGSATKGLYGVLTNSGTVNWTGTGSLNVYYASGSGYFGSIYNQLGGLFDIKNSSTIGRVYGPEFFSNAGTVRRSSGTSTSTMSIQMTNSATVEIQTGTLNFAIKPEHTGTFLLNGGTLSFSQTFTLTNGVIRGTGTFSGTLTNSSQVNPDGILTITGNYVQTGAGSLSIGIGGLTAGTQYDRLVVNGQATLGGTLNLGLLNAFVPAVNDAFQVLTVGSGNTTFPMVTGRSIGAGLYLVPSYTATTLTFTALDLNGRVTLLSNGPGGFQFRISGGGDTYKVEACTSLKLKDWTTLGTYSIPGGSMDLVDAQSGNFPTRFYRASYVIPP